MKPFSLVAGPFRPFIPAILLTAAAAFDSAAQNQRVLGLDISAWQGNISQTTWNNIRTNENRVFVVLRSSRGGTTGYYNQNDSDNSDGLNTLSQRYDDPYFIQNVNRASAAGMYVGTYHFSRPDIIESTVNSGGIRNNGTDEADHFIQMAGPWMRPGYLLPVHDLEAGISQRTSSELAQFAIDFSNRIYERMGIRPAVYTGGNYANYLQSASLTLQDQLAKPAALLPSVVSPACSVLWTARWPNQADPNSIDVQNGEPKDSYTPIYGPWDNYGVTHPWTIWQYASTLRLQSFNNGGNNLDADVMRGGVEFLKDNLVPAVWMHDGSGLWTTLTNWNSGQTPVQPVAGPGQVTPVASGPLPTPRLPSTNDTIILERPNANITVTIDSGTHSIRKLYAREALEILGGSLTVNYRPSWDSTTNAAQFSAPVILSNANLSVHTFQVDTAQTFTVSSGTLVFHELKLMAGTSPATLVLNGSPSLNSLSNSVWRIVSGPGSGSAGRVDFGGVNRTFNVPAGNDYLIGASIINGGLTKSGSGILRVAGTNTYTGGTIVNSGTLQVNNTGGSGTGSGSVTVNGGVLSGTGVISGATTISASASIAPGTETNLGTLTFGSPLTLSGATVLRVNRNGGSPSSDRVSRTGGALTFGGLLTVTNVGVPVTGSEVFTLFSASSYVGAFTGTNLPSLDAGLNWYLGNLGFNGTIAVNRSPAASFVSVESSPGQTLQIPISSLVNNGIDPDGDTLSLLAFDSVTTNGITLSSDGTYISYFNNADVADKFIFTLSDGHGGTASSAVLIGQGLPSAPAIINGPNNVTAIQGQDVTFNVTANGTGPLAYQWRFNNTNIAGATVSAYTRTNVQPVHAGAYTVVITNDYGVITSSPASLTVFSPPSITSHPQSTNVTAGQTASFSVAANGTGPLFYQWLFEGNPINGATASTYAVNNSSSNSVGSYSVVVTNTYGSVTSQPASLNVIPPGLLEVLWKIPPSPGTFLTTNDLPEQRGLAFNPVSRRLLVVHRMTTTVYVLDETGTPLWTLNTNNVTVGLNSTYYLLLIAAAEDGAVYACNLKASTALPFKIYRWANDNSNTVPTVAFNGDPSPATAGYRWGDTFDVRGSGTNTQILIGPRSGTNVVLFTTANGLDFTPRVINLTGIPNGNCGLNLTFGAGNTFWGTTHTNVLHLMAFDPVAGTASPIRTYSDSEVPIAVNPLGFSAGLNMIAGIHVNSPNHLRVYDLSPTNGVPYLVGTTNFFTDNDNTHTGTGAVRFDGNVIYALDANNGLMAVRVLVPTSPLQISQVIHGGQQFTLRGSGPIGSYLLEATSDLLSTWSPVATVPIGISGNFEFRETVTNAAQRYYRVKKQ